MPKKKLESLLTEEQREVLLITAEEAAEVTQIISKVLRFGLDNRWPADSPDDNQCRLEAEVGDLTCMIYLLAEKGLIRGDRIEAAAQTKLQRLKKWSNIGLADIDMKL